MPDEKISQLTDGGSVQSTDEFVIARAGANYKIAGSQIGGSGAVSSVFGRTGAVVAANGDYEGVVASALTGATASTRYVGGTTSGAPVSGTFAKGDFVATQDGHIFVCTTAGTPGSWTDAGSVSNLVTSVFGRAGSIAAVDGDYEGVVASAKTGATATTRYVGGTTSGAPVTGTFAKGDFVITQDGHVFICTTAGSPGTWRDAAGSGGSGTISDITSSGGSISVTAPTGPTTNVDVASSGVTAATYGDSSHVAQFAVRADGRITSASNVIISGILAGSVTYGDGSDGNVTFDGSTTILGLVPSGSTYTLNRDIFIAGGSINSGVTIITNCFRIFCLGTLINNGTIQWNGASATSNSGAPATNNSVGSISVSTATSGEPGAPGGAGTTTTGNSGSSLGGQGLGGAGGHGGQAVANNGGNGGNPTAPSSKLSIRSAPSGIVGWFAQGGGNWLACQGGCGGGGGGGDGANAGGGGGAGGGILCISATTISGTGAIQARGGNGFSPVAGNCGGGGGGGGGTIFVVSGSVSGGAISGQTIDANGGSHGSASGTGTNSGVADGSSGSVVLIPN